MYFYGLQAFFSGASGTSTGNSLFAVPIGGYYRISANGTLSGTGGGGSISFDFYTSTNSLPQCSGSVNQSGTTGYGTTMYCVVDTADGDTIKFDASWSNLNSGVPSSVRFLIELIS